MECTVEGIPPDIKIAYGYVAAENGTVSLSSYKFKSPPIVVLTTNPGNRYVQTCGISSVTTSSFTFTVNGSCDGVYWIAVGE